MNRQVEHKRFKKKHHVNTTQKKAAVAIRGRKKQTSEPNIASTYQDYMVILHIKVLLLSLKPWDKMLRCLFSISNRTWHSTVPTHHKAPPSSPNSPACPSPRGSSLFYLLPSWSLDLVPLPPLSFPLHPLLTRLRVVHSGLSDVSFIYNRLSPRPYLGTVMSLLFTYLFIHLPFVLL